MPRHDHRPRPQPHSHAHTLTGHALFKPRPHTSKIGPAPSEPCPREKATPITTPKPRPFITCPHRPRPCRAKQTTPLINSARPRPPLPSRAWPRGVAEGGVAAPAWEGVARPGGGGASPREAAGAGPQGRGLGLVGGACVAQATPPLWLGPAQLEVTVHGDVGGQHGQVQGGRLWGHSGTFGDIRGVPKAGGSYGAGSAVLLSLWDGIWGRDLGSPPI